MVNCGPHTNGTQFLITAKAVPALDGVNVVIGKVVAGMDILQNVIKNSNFMH